MTQGQQGDSGGVKAGMHIHAIDGVDCIGKSLDDVLVMVKAKKQSTERFKMTLVSERRQTQTVTKPSLFLGFLPSWASTFATKEICCLSTTKH